MYESYSLVLFNLCLTNRLHVFKQGGDYSVYSVFIHVLYPGWLEFEFKIRIQAGFFSRFVTSARSIKPFIPDKILYNLLYLHLINQTCLFSHPNQKFLLECAL